MSILWNNRDDFGDLTKTDADCSNAFNLIDKRIRLIQMSDDPCPIEPGATGTVTSMTAFQGAYNLSVKWDNGRTLGLVIPPDKIEVIQ